MLQSLSTELKDGVLKKSRVMTRGTSSKTFHDALEILKRHGIDSTRQNIVSMILPNTEGSIEMYYWMEEYFNLVGDHMPNSNEIHLETMPFKDLHKVYLDESFHKLSAVHFRWVWTNMFHHVKVREFKQV
jgi:hypothetical protein